MSDTVHDVTGWISERLGADCGTTVHTSFPGTSAGKTLIWMGDIDEAETRPSGFRAGRIRRVQQYDIPLIVEISGDGKSQQVADGEVSELQKKIDVFFATPANIQAQGALPSGSGSQVLQMVLGAWRQYRAPIAREGHWSSRMTTIRVTARIL